MSHCGSKRRFRLMTSLSAVALIGLGAPAHAQSTGEPEAAREAGGLEEIVVTAQRRAENLQKVPIAITAVTAQSLTTANVNDIKQLVKLAPGLQVYQIAGAIVPFIRGVGSNQSQAGFESPVAIYIDGVYQGAKTGNIMELNNIERIEVLKGPQGTLFGRNATGGAISITTADPSDEISLNVEGGYGRYNEKRAKVSAGGPVTDTVSVSVAATGRWDDGYIFNRHLQKSANPSSNMVALAKLVWKPSEDFTAKLSAIYADVDDTTGLATHPVRGTVPASINFQPTYANYEVTNGFDTVIKSSNWRYALNMNYDLGAVELVSITGYSHGDNYTLSDSDFSRGDISYSGSGILQKTFSQELQLQSGPGPLTYIAGLYYMWMDEGYGPRGKNFIAGGNVPAPVRPSDLSVANGGLGAANVSASGITATITTKALAAFAQATYQLAENTRLTAGIRFTQESKALDGESYRYIAVPAATNINTPLYNTVLTGDGRVFSTVTTATANLKKTFRKATWRLALDQQLTPDLLLYASYNRGFKSGSYAPSQVNPAQIPVNPEVLDAYEVGFKSEFLDRRVRFNAAAYYYDYKNIQVQAILSPGVILTQNAAAAELYGLDADMTAAVTDAFTLKAGLSIIKSKYKSFGKAQIFIPKVSPAACGATPQVNITQAQTIAATPVPAGVSGNCAYSLDATGQDVIFAPKWTFNVGGDYNLDLGDDGRILFTGSFYMNSGFDTAPGGIFMHIDRFNSLSASATFYGVDDRYFVRAWGDNLAGSHQTLYRASSTSGYSEALARPASYGLTVGFKI